MRLARLAAFALMLAAPAVAGPPARLPAWMSGTWSGGSGEVWLDESWTTPRGGMMMGAARVGHGEALDVWEVTRIEQRGEGLVFIAHPRGQAGGEFPMVGQGADWIEFANPAHDYPQRIRYWREGERLLAEISKLDGSGAERFEYARAAP